MQRDAPLSNSAHSNPVRKLVMDASGECITNLAVVIVTWRDHVHTAACLHSLLASRMRPRWIVVVDNGSDDETSQCLHEFLTGGREIEIHEPFSCLVAPLNASAHARCFSYITLDDMSVAFNPNEQPNKTLVRLITANDNGGFSSGNNIGIRYLEHVKHDGCIWLLNNDAYVAPDCINKLVLHGRQDGLPELFGTALVEYHEPERIQALGGMLSKLWLSPRNNFAGQMLHGVLIHQIVVGADYPVGASMLTWSDKLYRKNQPLFEGYFLYYEEPDLCAELGVAKCPIYVDAVVAHVGGATTGDAVRRKGKPSFARDYYGTRSRVIFSRRRGRGVVLVSLFCLLLAAKRLSTMNLRGAMSVLRGGWSGFSADLGGN